MKKKIVTLMLVASMALSVCACGQKTPEKSSDVVNKTESGTPASKSEASSSSTVVEEEKTLYPIVSEPITIKGMVMGGTGSTKDEFQNDRKIWQKVAEITGIKIEWEVVDKETINTRLAGGNWPDIFFGNYSDTIVNDYGVVGGRFLNFADYLDYMPHLVKTHEDYPELKKATTESNGEIYRTGTVNVAATSTSVRTHVNMEVLRNAGITKKPETIDEFYQALVALKEKNGEAGFIPYIGEKSTRSYWRSMLFAAFGPMVGYDWEADANEKVVFSRATEQMKRYWTFMNKLYEEGLIHQECATLDTLVRADLEKTSGNIAFIESSASGAISAEHFASGKLEMDTCAPFTSEYDDTRTVVAQNPVNLWGVLVNADTKYPTEICQMIDIMYAEEEVVEGSGLFGTAFAYGRVVSETQYKVEKNHG